MSFLPEPAFPHDQTGRTAVLLVNLGTPDAPEAGPVRAYLKEFLSDPRVVEIPRLVWWLILNGIILRVRPRKSAEKYASIWTPQGSPLKFWSEQQAALLRGYLGERGFDVEVTLAMRYGRPSIADTLAALGGVLRQVADKRELLAVQAAGGQRQQQRHRSDQWHHG